MKKILIPTDFQIGSVLLLKEILQNLNNEKVSVTFLYGHQLTPSINGLLFFKEHEIIENAITKDFRDSLEIIQNKYTTSIENIQYELFTGFTTHAFHNYLSTKDFDTIYLIKNYKMKFKKSSGKSIIPFIHTKDNNKVCFIELMHEVKSESPMITALFTH